MGSEAVLLTACGLHKERQAGFPRPAQAFPPMGKFEAQTVQRLAALYGLKHSVQGSGKKRFVVVTATHRTRMPDQQGLEQLARLLGGSTAAAQRPAPTKTPLRYPAGQLWYHLNTCWGSASLEVPHVGR